MNSLLSPSSSAAEEEWCEQCPKDNWRIAHESALRSELRLRFGPGFLFATGILRQSRVRAVSVSRTATALGAFFRRLAARVGKAKAVTATARKIATVLYNTMRHGRAYVDPGASYYEERYRERTLNNLRRRAGAMGFALVASAVE